MADARAEAVRDPLVPAFGDVEIEFDQAGELVIGADIGFGLEQEPRLSRGEIGVEPARATADRDGRGEQEIAQDRIARDLPAAGALGGRVELYIAAIGDARLAHLEPFAGRDGEIDEFVRHLRLTGRDRAGGFLGSFDFGAHRLLLGLYQRCLSADVRHRRGLLLGLPCLGIQPRDQAFDQPLQPVEPRLRALLLRQHRRGGQHARRQQQRPQAADRPLVIHETLPSRSYPCKNARLGG